MRDETNFAQKIFFGLGERIGLIIIAVVFLSLFFLETATNVFSEEEKVYAGYSKSGLTFDNYLNSSDSEEKDLSEQTVSLNHDQESTLEHNVFVDPKEEDIWNRIAACESGGNWSINTGNGYYGGLQFSEGAWRSVGGSGLANEASRDEQIMRGKMLQERRGWGVWGLCAKKLGLN